MIGKSLIVGDLFEINIATLREAYESGFPRQMGDQAVVEAAI